MEALTFTWSLYHCIIPVICTSNCNWKFWRCRIFRASFSVKELPWPLREPHISHVCCCIRVRLNLTSLVENKVRETCFKMLLHIGAAVYLWPVMYVENLHHPVMHCCTALIKGSRLHLNTGQAMSLISAVWLILIAAVCLYCLALLNMM
jgi:hypothetical protein